MTHPLSLLIGWLLDLMVGDPQRLPHPVVWFGKMIAACERKLNRGTNRKLKGALTAWTVLWMKAVGRWPASWGVTLLNSLPKKCAQQHWKHLPRI